MNLFWSSALVKISAIISWWSNIKYQYVLHEYVILDSEIVWCSLHMIVASICGKSSSFNRVLSHMALCIAFEEAMYLASTVEIATTSCFLNDQETKLPSISNFQLLIDFWSYVFYAQLASIHPTNFISSMLRPPGLSAKSLVLFSIEEFFYRQPNGEVLDSQKIELPGSLHTVCWDESGWHTEANRLVRGNQFYLCIEYIC